jgi:hypothetical protein
MSEEEQIYAVFSSILLENWIKAPLEKIDIEGVHDEPGFHWSNPGVKMVSALAGGKSYPFVLKTLGEHSKREILVYRFLSGQEGFPIPRLFHDVYDEDRKEYRMVIERCVGRSFFRPEDFWVQCGLLLTRIHSIFWNKVDILPDFFNAEIDTERLRKAVDRLSVFLSSLSTKEIGVLEDELGISLSNLFSVLDGVVRESLLELPGTDRCLIHGAFHQPEIMWRETSGGYIPLGVDWERCRVGTPPEDLAFSVISLLAKGENTLFNTFLDTYLSESGKYGISLDRDEVSASVRYEALIQLIAANIPFLLQTYLRVRNDKGFAEWCRWLKQDIPYSVQFIHSYIESSRIYRK